MTYKFTTIITKEDRWYVARCLEINVTSQGKTIEKAQANLKEAVELYLEGEDISDISSPAPFISTLEVDLV